MKISLVLCPGVGNYSECSHGRDWERDHSCFSERAGAWVDPPRRGLLGRVTYKTGAAPFCFMLPVHVSVKNAQEDPPC